MALTSQLGSFPITGGDIPCQNLTGTDIPAFTGVIFDTTAATGTLAVKPPATAGSVARTAGVTVEKIVAGRSGRVRMIGSEVATAHGAVTAGDSVQIDSGAGFEGQVKTQVAATTQLGRALTSAADQDPVLVMIEIATNA